MSAAGGSMNVGQTRSVSFASGPDSFASARDTEDTADSPPSEVGAMRTTPPSIDGAAGSSGEAGAASGAAASTDSFGWLRDFFSGPAQAAPPPEEIEEGPVGDPPDFWDSMPEFDPMVPFLVLATLLSFYGFVIRLVLDCRWVKGWVAFGSFFEFAFCFVVLYLVIRGKPYSDKIMSTRFVFAFLAMAMFTAITGLW